MSNVLIAIIVLLITFVLMGLGVYENVEASRRSSLAMTVGSKMSRLGTDNKEMALELGRNLNSPTAESSTGLAFYDQNALDREAFGSVSFSFVQNASGYYICARSSDVNTTTQEAFEMVARDRPPSFVSGACGVAATPITTTVAVSMRLN